ncbi:MAG TPA: UDP-N-acetylmuramate--L-alanine ligase [Acidimicrobiales bacterium]|nr:UDP-N-acetylmuramate--L-alanine ligase [Acidimicrobiales bacterium]
MTNGTEAATDPIDLSVPTRIHIVGVGGAGMSAIALVLLRMGHDVSGSDLKESSTTDRLRSMGATIGVGHAARNVDGAVAVAISTAIPPTNVEVVAALAAGIAVLSRADILSAIAAMRRTVAISGTHGKTTTTSMLSLILAEAGLDPSFIIGGEVNEIGTNANWGAGELFIVEADESDGTFLRLGADVALVTSIDPDHLEHYGGYEALQGAFATFLADAPRRIVCADDPGLRALSPPGTLTYGFAKDADFRIEAFAQRRAEITFVLTRNEERIGSFNLPVPGALNAQNAAGAIAAATLLGASPAACHSALARFAGVARRFQFRGEKGGITFVDDYAHLPTEVRATLAAAKAGGWRRTVAVFQPHRYSRTEAVGTGFADAFSDADVVVVTAIDPAGEAPRPGISAKLVLDAILTAHPDTAAVYLPARADLVAYLARNLRPGDCCITLGAGDLTRLPDEILASLAP